MNQIPNRILEQRILNIFQDILYDLTDNQIQFFVKSLTEDSSDHKIDPDLTLQLDSLMKRARELTEKKYSGDPEKLDFFQNISGARIEAFVRDFAGEFESAGFNFKQLEYDPRRFTKEHLTWMETQAKLIMTPPLTHQSKSDGLIVLPLLFLFEQLRSDFNYLIRVFFQPLIKPLLEKQKIRVSYKNILNHFLPGEGEKIAIIRNSIVRNKFNITSDGNVQFFKTNRSLKQKPRLEIDQEECRRLTISLNNLIWLLLLSWLKHDDHDHKLDEIVSPVKYLFDSEPPLRKALEHSSNSDYWFDYNRNSIKIDLMTGRHDSAINQRNTMNYLRESSVFFTSIYTADIDNLKIYSMLLGSRILYLYNYNSMWMEYIYPVGSWLLKRGGKRIEKYSLWETFAGFPDGSFSDLLKMFNPAIRNALVHGEFHVDNEGNYTFYSIRYPQHSPITCRLPVMKSFMVRRAFDRYFHPNIRKSTIKMALAKYWITALGKKEKEKKYWENELLIVQDREDEPLKLLMRVRLVTAGSNLMITKEFLNELNLLYQKLRELQDTENYQTVITLVISALYIYSRKKLYRDRFLERILTLIENLGDIDVENRILIAEILQEMAVLQKDARKIVLTKKKIKRLKRYG